MRREDYQRASELFEEVFDLDPAERARVLAEKAPSTEVRREVEHLLQTVAGGVLGEEDLGAANAELLAAVEADLPDIETIGPYHVIERIGEGGMGVVYLAEQRQPRRRVAVKVMRGGFVEPGLLRRFELEAEFLGRLQHSGIAQVYEFGVAGEGPRAQMYLAMEYIDGAPITKFADDAGLGQRGRIELLTQVCDAVHHAHVRGVMHRDLKPSNILVTADGRTKIIDFGVARALDREADATFQTHTGQIVGTLAYMSPEQVSGEVEQVDTRADVYALGVLAYELLSGRLPLDTMGKPVSQIVRMIVEDEPRRLGKVSRDLRGDLEWIVAQAMEKSSARRYQSAGALAADLRRVVDHEPIQARPPTAIYQLRKLARRHRIAVAGVAATLLAILVGGGFAVDYAIRNADLVELEKAERKRADARTEEAVGLAEAERLAREEAVRTGADLRVVGDFLGERLKQIDSQAMGDAILQSLESELRRTWQRSGVADDEIGDRWVELEARLREANMTTVAVKTMDGALFQPMRAQIDRAFSGRPELMVKMLASHARLLASKGLLRESDLVYEEVMALGEELPEDTPDLLRAQLYRSIDLGRLGRWDDIKTLLARVLERARAVLGTDDPAVVNAVGGLARAEQLTKNHERAEQLYLEQIELLEASRARHDDSQVRSDLMIAFNNYGSLLHEANRAEEARPIVKSMYALADGGGAAREELLVHALGLDALTQMATGDTEEGERVSWKALEMSRKVNGDFSSTTSLQRRILIDLLERASKFADAEGVIRDEMNCQLRHNGKDTFNFMLTELKLAGALFEQQKYGEARTIAAEGLALAEKNVGPSHMLTQAMVQLLSSVCDRQVAADGDAEAEKILVGLRDRYGDLIGESK